MSNFKSLYQQLKAFGFDILQDKSGNTFVSFYDAPANFPMSSIRTSVFNKYPEKSLIYWIKAIKTYC